MFFFRKSLHGNTPLLQYVVVTPLRVFSSYIANYPWDVLWTPLNVFFRSTRKVNRGQNPLVYYFWRTSIPQEAAHQPENFTSFQSLPPKQSSQPFWPELYSEKYTSINNPNQSSSLVCYHRLRRHGNEFWITFQQLHTYANTVFHSRSSVEIATEIGMRLHVNVCDVPALAFHCRQWTAFLLQNPYQDTTTRILLIFGDLREECLCFLSRKLGVIWLDTTSLSTKYFNSLTRVRVLWV